MCSTIEGAGGFHLDGFLNFGLLNGSSGLSVDIVSGGFPVVLFVVVNLSIAKCLLILKWNLLKSSDRMPRSGGSGVSTNVRPLLSRLSSASLSVLSDRLTTPGQQLTDLFSKLELLELVVIWVISSKSVATKSLSAKKKSSSNNQSVVVVSTGSMVQIPLTGPGETQSVCLKDSQRSFCRPESGHEGHSGGDCPDSGLRLGRAQLPGLGGCWSRSSVEVGQGFRVDKVQRVTFGFSFAVSVSAVDCQRACPRLLKKPGFPGGPHLLVD